MNPLILRGIREKTSASKHLIAAGLFSLIVCSTAYMISYLEGEKGKYAYDPQTKEWTRVKIHQLMVPEMHFTFVVILTRVLSNVLGYWTSRVYYR